MSAHAIACRRDLQDLFALLLELLEPFFLFLLDGRRSPARTVEAPPVGLSSVPAPASVVEVEPASPVPVAVGVVGSHVPVEVAPSAEIPHTEPASGLDDGEPATAFPVPVSASGLLVDATDPAGAEPSPAAGPLFVKVNGRFRPAPAGHDGPVFVRVRSDGGRVTYRPATA